MYYDTPSQKAFWQELTDFSINTYRKFLAGDWEHRIIEVPNPEHHDYAFKECYDQIKKWNKKGHNVYYTNVDIIVVKPIQIFGEYEDMKMWWTSDPRMREPFGLNFNCGTAYFPKEMDKSLWDYADNIYKTELAKTDRPDWALDQDIYNFMLHMQNGDVTRHLDNTMHYLVGADGFNNIQKEEAKLLHYFTTRGADQAFARMKEDWSKVCG